MYTARKRHLKKKRFFLPKEKIFALYNGSNLKTSKVAKIKLSLKNAQLYSVPLYLRPPKLALGCPLIMIVYKSLQDLQVNLPELTEKIDCLGVSLNDKWYPIEIFTKKNLNNLDKKILSLLLTKAKKIEK